MSNPIGYEIERKFWLPTMPPLVVYVDHNQVPCLFIEQAYLPAEEGETRVRRSGRKYFLTVKKGEGLVRQETEVELPRVIYDSLRPLAVGRTVNKNRYFFKFGQLVLELDEYTGYLAGLVVLECEFKTEEEAHNFTLPDWAKLAVDVTSDKRFKNKSLSLALAPPRP
ncbi:MAG: hypothetical protein A2571_00515 [Candidatus Vogelbacteria bacterium RIFOXYD1_FULL_44_32]|uniref:CYTH domain-containing protein n=1 Tax=Candidatus Vogelbacteria bacterium RIFOXYD1_FULL_44_32 TaxID=1802438 RepID=A0A1G2QE68_9BACT|nr:MAG: hypothetical protein A2571_00515 [Candidatus Vogelbacteria bacterium RIFOXYD1_FULL_44_32]